MVMPLARLKELASTRRLKAVPAGLRALAIETAAVPVLAVIRDALEMVEGIVTALVGTVIAPVAEVDPRTKVPAVTWFREAWEMLRMPAPVDPAKFMAELTVVGVTITEPVPALTAAPKLSVPLS